MRFRPRSYDHSRIRSTWRRAIAQCLLIFSFCSLGCLQPVAAQAIDLSTFTVESYPLTDGFPAAEWLTTASEAKLDDAFASNASVNVLYGPDSVLGRRIVGNLSPHPNDGRGADDDGIGFVVGFQPGDAEFFSDDALEANYVLIDWKGISQSFDFNDAPGQGFFHGATLGGPMPAGLALSQVKGVPTADELWQHVDSADGVDGGVTELARARTLGTKGYNRSGSAAPYAFDITYSEDRVTVIVDGELQLDVRGEFEDGRFGLYTLSQGPTPVFSDFAFAELREFPDAFPEVTIDRNTGELTISNPGSSPTSFTSYSIASTAGALDATTWSTVSASFTGGSPGGIDTSAWIVSEASPTRLAETDSVEDGGALSGGQSINLGPVWNLSQFEDVSVSFQLIDGLIVPVVPTFVGNGGNSYSRSDLNTDGQIDLSDWQLFFPHALEVFPGMSRYEASLLGDLDGDFDNDIADFGLFKADYELVHGDGAFAAMVASVPEPSAALLLLLGPILALALRSRPQVALMLLMVLGCSAGEVAHGQMLDFTTFTVERFAPTSGFAEAEWDATEDTATILGGANASANVFYSEMNVLGKRIHGFLSPSTDDDIVGMVFGFQPGDASFGDESADANYLLLDWKGIDQDFDFNDPQGTDPPFNNLTGSGPMPAGLALSRVTGLPNSDELWQHRVLEGNSLGGVDELGRGLTLGSTGYNRDPNAPPVEFDILFEADRVVVVVDGKLEFFEGGDFSDGRFGLYTGWQSAGPVFSEFELLEVDTLDLTTLVLHAEVDRRSGDIVVSNNTGEALNFDYYQFHSGVGALRTTWTGLADAEAGSANEGGLGWVEAGGSGATAIAELFLVDAGGTYDGLTLQQGDSITIQGAYNGAIPGEDLRFSYRFPDGSFNAGLVSYVGDAPIVSNDCNGDGQVNTTDLSCANAAGTTAMLLQELGLVLGDLDGTEGVAFGDFLVLSANFGQPTNNYALGDIDGNGDVGFSDFLILSANFGTGATAVASVPEPIGSSLLAMGLCGILVVRRRTIRLR